MMVWALSLLTMKLIPHCLTPMLLSYGIRSLVGFGIPLRTLVHLVLYPRKKTHEATPTDISRRTSYLQV